MQHHEPNTKGSWEVGELGDPYADHCLHFRTLLIKLTNLFSEIDHSFDQTRVVLKHHQFTAIKISTKKIYLIYECNNVVVRRI